AVPAGHRFADRTVTLDELQNEPLVLMQEGAGVRQVIDDELREAGVRLRDLDVRLELGLQESARSAVLGGYGVTFISRSAIEADLAAGTVAVARVEGLEPSREIFLVRSAGRAETRVAQAFVEFARSRAHRRACAVERGAVASDRGGVGTGRRRRDRARRRQRDRSRQGDLG